MNRLRDTSKYMLPKADEMPEDRKLNRIRNMYNNRPTISGRTKYRRYADKEAGKNWKEISRVLKYAERIVSEIISCFKENNKFCPKYSTEYYYGKRIHSLFPQYRFSECKKIFFFFDKLQKNPIIEKSRDDYLETVLVDAEVENNDRSYIDTIKGCRKIILDIMSSIRKNIRDIGSADMKNKIKEYRERYRTSTEEGDGIYAEDHPYIVALKKIDDCFRELREKFLLVQHVINFFDYKMDRIIRTYASQLCYSYRFVHYWLHIITRLFTDVVQVWDLPEELPCQVFETCGEKKKVVVVRRKLVQIMKRFKKCVEDGSYKPHMYEQMVTVPDAYDIYKYTKIFYDQLCEVYRNLAGHEIRVVHDVHNDICARVYNLEPSSDFVYYVNRIIRRIGSTDPSQWPNHEEVLDMLLEDAGEIDNTAVNGSAGGNVLVDEGEGGNSAADEGEGGNSPADEEEEENSPADEEEEENSPTDEEEEENNAADEDAQTNATNGSHYDGNTSDSSYNCYGNRLDSIEDSAYYCDGK
ncbi:hypothetical protein PVNG_06575 [Plasmodium vivax North Korean]|uniref:Uncharacterized protein n=1 Tax=Plasmodium vivax North Korean TaxID=1035514 RepID=A0A0J9U2E7_PLAVI|nr:hypothetical protein PVNG_06575 [Plasmodium vivax North Korean]